MALAHPNGVGISLKTAVVLDEAIAVEDEDHGTVFVLGIWSK